MANVRIEALMREIPLTRGLVALVDDENYDRIARFSWYATPGHKTFYAQRRGPRNAQGKRLTISMHRLVLNMPTWTRGGLEVDHVDRNGLNNTRSNLRAVTHAGNAANRTDVRWLEDRPCVGCGVVFHPTNAARLFCTQQCFGRTRGLSNLASTRPGFPLASEVIAAIQADGRPTRVLVAERGVSRATIQRIRRGGRSVA